MLAPSMQPVTDEEEMATIVRKPGRFAASQLAANVAGQKPVKPTGERSSTQLGSTALTKKARWTR